MNHMKYFLILLIISQSCKATKNLSTQEDCIITYIEENQVNRSYFDKFLENSEVDFKKFSDKVYLVVYTEFNVDSNLEEKYAKIIVTDFSSLSIEYSLSFEGKLISKDSFKMTRKLESIISSLKIIERKFMNYVCPVEGGVEESVLILEMKSNRLLAFVSHTEYQKIAGNDSDQLSSILYLLNLLAKQPN